MKHAPLSILSLAIMAFPFSAHAQEATAVLKTDMVVAAPAGQNCKLVETVQFGVNFNNINVDPKTAKTYMDEKIAELRALAADLGIEKLEIQNLNYSVYNNNYNYGGCGAAPAPATPVVQLNGNVSFIVEDSAKGTALMEKAGEKGYNVNFNLNAYRQCQ
ncbi:MAG: hypothetical protein KA099_04415 [Alphaproteobacteria bacterium]|jgi:uncharacterized protein YggE|nr:hypothetical protein [Alphaproteobacteria bacterium]MBP7757726.1 hypothetical protein [Alphaproteobacteria bacterium]MBP7761074.1 hypothetical protein [Alphaproteobacteria bacterium]MBP7904552.1 hypothetical protein [Alphaproteobacteria bacterium]